MLKANQLAAALGLLAILTVGLAWWTFPVSPTTQQYQYDHPRNGNFQPGGRVCQPSALAAIPDTKVRLNKAEQCAAEAEQYRQASDDLIQQTRAANAAQAQAVIASQQLWIAWLQTLGGFLTLCAAIAAAVYAGDAAREGKRAADEAEGNRKSYIASERAILHALNGHVSELSITKAETVSIEFINRGRTAARVIRIGTGALGSEALNDQSQRWTTIGPGETAWVAGFAPPSKNEIAKVDCWIEYLSLSPDPHRSHFTVTVQWYENRDPLVFALSSWMVSVTNQNGHPDDT